MPEGSNGDVPRVTARCAVATGEVSRGEDEELRSLCKGKKNEGAAVGVEISREGRERICGDVIFWGCRIWRGSGYKVTDKDGRCWY